MDDVDEAEVKLRQVVSEALFKAVECVLHLRLSSAALRELRQRSREPARFSMELDELGKLRDDMTAWTADVDRPLTLELHDGVYTASSNPVTTELSGAEPILSTLRERWVFAFERSAVVDSAPSTELLTSLRRLYQAAAVLLRSIHATAVTLRGSWIPTSGMVTYRLLASHPRRLSPHAAAFGSMPLTEATLRGSLTPLGALSAAATVVNMRRSVGAPAAAAAAAASSSSPLALATSAVVTPIERPFRLEVIEDYVDRPRPDDTHRLPPQPASESHASTVSLSRRDVHATTVGVSSSSSSLSSPTVPAGLPPQRPRARSSVSDTPVTSPAATPLAARRSSRDPMTILMMEESSAENLLLRYSPNLRPLTAPPAPPSSSESPIAASSGARADATLPRRRDSLITRALGDSTALRGAEQMLTPALGPSSLASGAMMMATEPPPFTLDGSDAVFESTSPSPVASRSAAAITSASSLLATPLLLRSAELLPMATPSPAIAPTPGHVGLMGPAASFLALPGPALGERSLRSPRVVRVPALVDETIVDSSDEDTPPRTNQSDEDTDFGDSRSAEDAAVTILQAVLLSDPSDLFPPFAAHGQLSDMARRVILATAPSRAALVRP